MPCCSRVNEVKLALMTIKGIEVFNDISKEKSSPMYYFLKF